MIDINQARADLAKAGWRSDMEMVPASEPIEIALRVRDKDGVEWWRYNLVHIDDDTWDIVPDEDRGWAIAEYTHWRPVIDPDQPDPLALHLSAALAEIERLRDTLGKLIAWHDIVGPQTDDAGDYLNGDGWDDLDNIATKARALLADKETLR